MIIALTVSSVLTFKSQKTQSVPDLKEKNEEVNKFWPSYKVSVFFPILKQNITAARPTRLKNELMKNNLHSKLTESILMYLQDKQYTMT